MSEPAAAEDHGPTRLQRRVVVVAFVLLLVPGLVGFDAWPLTGWRLFSLARTDRQTRWVVETVDGQGTASPFSLEQLPMRYRNAEWPLSSFAHISQHRREAECQALLAAVRVDHEDVPRLEIVRDDQTVVHRAGRWVVVHDRTVLHTCASPVAR